MAIIERIKKLAKKDVKTIILPEPEDPRVLKGAFYAICEGFANIILIGDKQRIEKVAKNHHIPLTKMEIVDPLYDENFDTYVNQFYEMRKHKGITLEDAKKMVKDPLYYGCMMIKNDRADGQVSGAIHSTSDTLRPALQIIKNNASVMCASSFFLMEVPNCEYGEKGTFIFADCGLIQNPSSDEMVSIAKSSYDTFMQLVGGKENLAFLSHSTYGSSNCPDVDKIKDAVNKFRDIYPDINADGELQFDAAVVPDVAKIKAPLSNVAGKANILIFPDLDSGNICYKAVQRLAKASAFGPVMQGLNKPVNDLSRGCNADDVAGVIAITAVQAQNIGK